MHVSWQEVRRETARCDDDPTASRSPDDTLTEAARRMSERDVGMLPVCDADRIVGILTDRDIVVRSVARGDDPRRVRVAEAMTHEVGLALPTTVSTRWSAT